MPDFIVPKPNQIKRSVFLKLGRRGLNNPLAKEARTLQQPPHKHLFLIGAKHESSIQDSISDRHKNDSKGQERGFYISEEDTGD